MNMSISASKTEHLLDELDGLLLDSLKTTAGPLVIYNIIMLYIYILWFIVMCI